MTKVEKTAQAQMQSRKPCQPFALAGVLEQVTRIPCLVSLIPLSWHDPPLAFRRMGQAPLE